VEASVRSDERCEHSGDRADPGRVDRQSFTVCVCGNRVKVNRDGTLRRHVPPGNDYRSGRRATVPPTLRRPGHTRPEWLSRQVIYRANADRDDEIVRLRKVENLTLEAIGRRYGLTRERVRQIVAERSR
jgi:hypothetical protein